MNILENAIKYTDAGGEVAISVHPLELYGDPLADNGIGIRAEELSAIFQRFLSFAGCGGAGRLGHWAEALRMILAHEKGYITAASDYGKEARSACFAECGVLTNLLEFRFSLPEICRSLC